MKQLIDNLHPALAAWFCGRFEKLTDVQAKALPHTLSGENTLILAPTGSGKTLSAFLACLSNLAGVAGTTAGDTGDDLAGRRLG